MFKKLFGQQRNCVHNITIRHSIKQIRRDRRASKYSVLVMIVITTDASCNNLLQRDPE